MAKPEQQLFDYLKKRLTWPWIERVENRANLGTPDVHFIGHETTGWIELKQLPTMNPGNLVGLRKEQVVWHLSYAQAGGVSWIVLRAGGTYFLWSGKEARRLVRDPIRVAQDYAEECGGKDAFLQRLNQF